MVTSWGTIIAIGMTVRASGNRIAEPLDTVLFSYLSIALFGMTTGNQATHCIFAWGFLNNVNQANQVFNSAHCGQA
jgi:hypothetical protein